MHVPSKYHNLEVPLPYEYCKHLTGVPIPTFERLCAISREFEVFHHLDPTEIADVQFLSDYLHFVLSTRILNAVTKACTASEPSVAAELIYELKIAAGYEPRLVAASIKWVYYRIFGDIVKTLATRHPAHKYKSRAQELAIQFLDIMCETDTITDPVSRVNWPIIGTPTPG